MATKKNDATGALVAVIAAVEPLHDADRHWVLQSAASKFALILQTAAGGGQAGAASTNTAALTPPVGITTASDLQATIPRLAPRALIRLNKPTPDVRRATRLRY